MTILKENGTKLGGLNEMNAIAVSSSKCIVAHAACMPAVTKSQTHHKVTSFRLDTQVANHNVIHKKILNKV